MLADMRYLIEISACEGKRGKAGLDRGRSGLWYMPGNALANLKRALEQDLLFRGSIIEPSLSACCLRKGMTMGQTALWSRSSAWWAGSWSWRWPTVLTTAGQQVFLKRGIWEMHPFIYHIGRYLENQPRLKEKAEDMSLHNQETQRTRRLESKDQKTLLRDQIVWVKGMGQGLKTRASY